MRNRAMIFDDRYHAGRLLAHKLINKGYNKKYLVLALPRGGVPVAHEVAMELGAELDVFVVRKLGLPGHEEFAIGAIAPGGVTVLNRGPIARYGLSDAMIQEIAKKELAELNRRLETYRKGSRDFSMAGRDVIVIDDGLATGSTMKAACKAIKQYEPKSLHVAVPVGSPRTCREIRSIADAVVCLTTPDNFSAVGQFYKDFRQTGDDEVMTLLARRTREPKEPRHAQEERGAAGI